MKKIILGSVLIFLFCGLLWYSKSDRDRKPAAVVDTENIQTLLSIPLVKNLERPDSTEERDTLQLIDLFEKFALKNRTPDGSLNRGTHAKGKCFRGYLEVLSTSQMRDQNIPEQLSMRLKRGIWSQDGQWPVVMRFANANGMGKIQSDKEPDVRGFSFSVGGLTSLNAFSGEGRQDFMMNSTPQFATGGIREFVEVVKAANNLIYKDFSYIPSPRYYPAIGRALRLISEGNKDGSHLKSYAHMNYWSNLPYTHGISEDGQALDVVKYKATPCDGKGLQKISNLKDLSDNYLQEEIVDHSNNKGVCFFIQVQFMNLEALKRNSSFSQRKWTVTDWIEHGGLLWDEKDMPFYTVGRVVIEMSPQKNSTSEVSCNDQYINTRLHSNPANQPVGSIARVRTLVEENSRQKRMNH